MHINEQLNVKYSVMAREYARL